MVTGSPDGSLVPKARERHSSLSLLHQCLDQQDAEGMKAGTQVNNIKAKVWGQQEKERTAVESWAIV